MSGESALALSTASTPFSTSAQIRQSFLTESNRRSTLRMHSLSSATRMDFCVITSSPKLRLARALAVELSNGLNAARR